MMIRPQQKQQKKRREMLNSLRKGDQIITIGGIQGTIKALREDRVVLEIAKGVDITILKTAVGQVIEEENTNEDNEPEVLPEGEVTGDEEEN
jgi:preprotein translocase subunit YajC